MESIVLAMAVGDSSDADSVRENEPGDGVTLLRGADIRRLRLRAHLSVVELATRIHYSPAQVRAWERERYHCPPSMYLAIIEATRAARRAWEQLAEDVRQARDE